MKTIFAVSVALILTTTSYGSGLVTEIDEKMDDLSTSLPSTTSVAPVIVDEGKDDSAIIGFQAPLASTEQRSYRFFQADPMRITEIASEAERDNILKVFNSYRDLCSCILDVEEKREKLRSLKEGNKLSERQRQIGIFREQLKAVLDLKYGETERITSLTRQRIEIVKGYTEALQLIERYDTETQNNQVELLNKIRDKTRSIFGIIWDNVWKKDIGADAIVPTHRMREILNDNQERLIGQVDHEIRAAIDSSRGAEQQIIILNQNINQYLSQGAGDNGGI